MSENQRSSRRYDRRLPIEFAIDDGPGKDQPEARAWRTAQTRNLSLGGVFIETAECFPFGARVRVRFTVPTQREAIEAVGQVRWADSDGMGVQFDGLRARDVWALGKFFEKP